MFYPGGGYPGLYFWLFPSSVAQMEVFEIEVGVCLLSDVTANVNEQTDIDVGVPTAMTLTVEVEQ